MLLRSKDPCNNVASSLFIEVMSSYQDSGADKPYEGHRVVVVPSGYSS